MMSAPDARTPSGFIALTVAAVPTGMNAGVRISPRCIAIVPVRAEPSAAEMEKVKRVIGAALTACPMTATAGMGWPMIDPWMYLALTAVAILTGFIDAIAGGGGLIMLPALLFAGVP